MDRKTAAPVRIVAVALSFFLSSCALPDLQPFADATAELNTAMQASGDVVTTALRENEIDGDEQAERFSAAFRARTRAMTAFVSYSDSLAAIAAAGEKGAESAGQVADALNGLLTDIGSVVPGLPTISASVVGVISEGYALIATVRAARSMKEAVETADPIVQRLAFLIGSDLKDMKEIIALAAENSVLRIQACLEPFNPAGCQSIEFLTDLKEAYSARAMESETELARKANSGETPGDDLVESARNWRGLATEVDTRLAERKALIAGVQRQTRVRLELLRNTEQGFESWAAIHARLAINLRDGTQPNARNLIFATNSLRGLIEKVQEL